MRVDDDNWDNDFATAISPSALHLPHLKPQDNFGGLLSADKLKAFASLTDARNDSESYDDDFEGELLTIKGPGQFTDFEFQEQTIRPTPRKKSDKYPEPMKQQSPPKPSPRKAGHARNPSRPKSPVKPQLGPSKFEIPAPPDLAFREQNTEDYSDLFMENDFNDGGLNPFIKKVDSPQLFHPSDLTSLPRSTQSPVPGSSRRPPSAKLRPSVLPDRPMRRTRSSIEIQKFAEDEGDEDFSDIFGPEDAVTEREESDRGSEDGGLMVLSKYSNNSWLGDDEDEDDPFASMDPGWDEMDLEANIARDRHARLAGKVEELVRSLKTSEGEEKLCELSEDLVSSKPLCPARRLTDVFSSPCYGKTLRSKISSSVLMACCRFWSFSSRVQLRAGSR